MIQDVCFVDRASLYNLVNKANLVHNFFLVCLFFFLYMFRSTIFPSSGKTTVFIRHFVLVILCGWLSGMHTRQTSIQNNKYQVSHKYSCFSWWWTHSRPKHVEKINKHTKNNIVFQCGFIYNPISRHLITLTLRFFKWLIFCKLCCY